MEAFMNGLLMTESSADRYERFMAFIPCLKKTAPLYRDFKVLEKDGIAIYTAPVQGLVQDLVQQYENLTSLDNDTICLADGDDANATVFSVKSFGEAATGSGVLILVLFGVILLLVFILCIVVACYESKLNRVVRKEHFPLRRARSVDNLPREIPYAIYRTEGQEGLVDAHVELAEDQDVPVDDPVQSDPKGGPGNCFC